MGPGKSRFLAPFKKRTGLGMTFPWLFQQPECRGDARVDFTFSEEQQHLRKSVREFAEGEIAPHVLEWD